MSRWEREVKPFFSRAVELLDNLMPGGHLLDELLSRNCLDLETYEDLLREVTNKEYTTAARRLLLHLKSSSSSYDSFRNLLLEKGDTDYKELCTTLQLSEPEPSRSISGVVGNFINKCFALQYRFTTFFSNIGDIAQKIIEQMQVPESVFTAEQVRHVFSEDHWWSLSKLESGKRLLKLIADSQDVSKEKFAFALFVIKPSLLNDIETSFEQTVSIKAAKAFIEIGGTSIAKKAFEERLLLRLKKPEAKIVLVEIGQSEIGKTTLVNSLFGEKKKHELKEEKEEERWTVLSNASGFRMRQLKARLPGEATGKCRLLLWDTPGLHATTNENTEQLYKLHKLVGKFDVLLLCIDFNSLRLSSADLNIMRTLFDVGNYLWKRTVVVFTRANLFIHRADIAESVAESDVESEFNDQRLRLAISVRRFLTDIGVDKETAFKVPCIPIGYGKQRILPDGQSWLPQFWTEVTRLASNEAAAFLLLFNRKRLGPELNATPKWVSSIAKAYEPLKFNWQLIFAAGFAGSVVGSVVAGPFFGVVLATSYAASAIVMSRGPGN